MFNFSYFFEVLPKVADHLSVTLELTAVSAVFALCIGLVVAIIAYYKIPVLYPVTRAYVFLMRGTPAIVQLYFFYYGIATFSKFIREMDPVPAVAIVMSLNIGAFMLGVIDIMGAAKIEGSYTFRYFEIYAAVMVIYLVVIGILTLIHKRIAARNADAY